MVVIMVSRDRGVYHSHGRERAMMDAIQNHLTTYAGDWFAVAIVSVLIILPCAIGLVMTLIEE
jgi:hypothetical protein